jgi:hypothetical protein
LGKVVKKIKFKSAEEKRRYEENERAWSEMCRKYSSMSRVKSPSGKADSVLSYSLKNPPGRERLELASRNTNGGSTAARESMTYTGTEMLGISLIHKSCLQPIFNEQAAKDAAGMRR